MRTINEWMAAYGRDHKNPTNQKIHLVCVPLIMWSLLGLLWALPIFSFMESIPLFNWATFFCFFCLTFYFFLDKIFMLMMLGVSVTMLFGVDVLQKSGWLLEVSIVVFIVAWVGQFIGHKIEGQKPSFLEDIQFLLIGPLWVLKELGNNISGWRGSE